MKRVEIEGIHLEATTGTPLVLLREQDEPHRVLPIFIGGLEATAIALALTGHESPRPMTHDLMAQVIGQLDAHVDHVEVTGVRDGSIHAELALLGPTGDQRVDSRPSDAIALAVRVGAPLFVEESVLDELGAVVPDNADDADDADSIDEGSIEAQVEAFRAELDHFQAGDLGWAERGDPEPPLDEV